MRSMGGCFARAVMALVVLLPVMVRPAAGGEGAQSGAPGVSGTPSGSYGSPGMDRESAFGCSALIAGRGTTVDGSILFAKTEDDRAEDIDFLWYIPRRRHEPGSVVKLENGGAVPQVALATTNIISLQEPHVPMRCDSEDDRAWTTARFQRAL